MRESNDEKKLRQRQRGELNCATGCDHAFGIRHETGGNVRKRKDDA